MEKTVKVVITSINLKLGVDVHGLSGMSVDKNVFDLSIPFQNKLGNGLLPDNLKGPPMTVSSITADRPFEVVSISPKLPVDVPYMSRIEFKLKLKAPETNYEGPLMIKFGTESSDNIELKIEKVFLISGDKKTGLDSSEINMNIKKSQIFKKDIQLYNILSFGSDVRSISINKPFEIASTTPSAPFKVDKKDSYVLAVFIKCPEYSYAGPLELTFG